MCTYTKLFACTTIAKELALFKAVSTLSKNPEIQGLRTGTLSHFPQNPATRGPYETRLKYSVHVQSVGLVKVQSHTTLKSSHPFLYDYHPVLELGYIFVNIYNDGNPGKIIMLRKISSAKKTKQFSPFNILSSL